MEEVALDRRYLDMLARRLKVVEDKLETLDWALNKEHERIDHIEEYLEREG